MNLSDRNPFRDVSVLIAGYDGYADVWDHCIGLMNRYWPDRPETYLATSKLCPQYENVKVIAAGPNTEWSFRVQRALEKIDTKYVILMLEDFFISDYVDNKELYRAIRLIKKDHIKFYQLFVQLIKQTWARGKAYKGNKHIHIIPKDKKYGLNLQAAVWDREFLIKAIGTGNYNAWQFEINQLGTKTYNMGKIEYLIDDRNLLNIVHGIVQSKYLPGAVKKLKKAGCHVDPGERKILEPKENFKYQLKLLMYSLIPRCLARPAKAVGRLMKIDFVTDRITSGQG